jgi:hypothetical protein
MKCTLMLTIVGIYDAPWRSRNDILMGNNTFANEKFAFVL